MWLDGPSEQCPHIMLEITDLLRYPKWALDKDHPHGHLHRPKIRRRYLKPQVVVSKFYIRNTGRCPVTPEVTSSGS